MQSSTLVKSIVKSPVVSSLLILALLAVALGAGSSALLVISGVLAFARPLAYIAVLNQEAAAEASSQARFAERATVDAHPARRASDRRVLLGAS